MFKCNIKSATATDETKPHLKGSEGNEQANVGCQYQRHVGNCKHSSGNEQYWPPPKLVTGWTPEQSSQADGDLQHVHGMVLGEGRANNVQYMP